MIKLLIVEDEPNYSDTLEMFVEQLGYTVVGIASNGIMARELFTQGKPDLILMDINLKGSISGIDLAHEFQSNRSIPIIFITSFEDKKTFAQAKETTPHAYLIKPFDSDTLERSLELAVQKTYSDSENTFSLNEAALASSYFFVKEKNRLVKICSEEILWVEVEDKYCILHTRKKDFVLRKSLKELTERLDSQLFVQTHRSFVVNITQIDDIDMQLFVVHINNKEIPLGRSHKDQLIQRLQIL